MSQSGGEESARFRVLRHGGRSGDEWRVLYDGAVYAEARRAYDDALEALRQGGVRFFVDDQMHASCWAPTLRSRW